MFFNTESIHNEIEYFLKIAESALDHSRALETISNDFASMNLKDKNFYKTAIEDYANKVNLAIPSLNLKKEEIINNFMPKIEALISAKNIAETSNQSKAGKTPDWYFYVFKNIRDLLLSDVEIVGKKEVYSYFKTYVSLNFNAKLIAKIVKESETQIINFYHGRTTDTSSSITEAIARGNVRLLDEKPGGDVYRKMDLQSPYGNLLYSSALHTLKNDGDIKAKDLSNYVSSAGVGKPITGANEEKKFEELNNFFNQFGIGFKDESHLTELFNNLYLYSQITGDDYLFLNFKTFLRNLCEKFQQKSAIEFIKNSFKDVLNSNVEKLKTIFRIKFNAKSISTLRDNKLVQVGNEVKLMKSESNTIPSLKLYDLVAKEQNLKVATASFNLLLQSVASEIDYFFNIN